MTIFPTTRDGAVACASNDTGHTRVDTGHARVPFGLLLVTLASLGGCNGAPSRNILGSYFPSWMVCALIGIAVAGIARAIFKASGILQELPVPFVVFLAIGCAATLGLWLIWLA